MAPGRREAPVSSPIAFSLTWAQLEALRSLPRPMPARGYPYQPDAALIAKGFASATPAGEIVPTAEGFALRGALVGLAPPVKG
jgi:hypothetical protein